MDYFFSSFQSLNPKVRSLQERSLASMQSKMALFAGQVNEARGAQTFYYGKK